MADEWSVMTLAEWQEKGILLFGEDVNYWQFICPSCGHIQTRAEWLSLGMQETMIDTRLGFSCIGRWLDPLDRVEFGERSKGKGCNYVGDHAPNISPITVIISEGEERPTFGFKES